MPSVSRRWSSAHNYAIVDEVDSILIDEARTPLIISGPAEGSTEKYYKIDRVIPKLTRAATIVEGKLSEIEATASGDYIVDEKARAVSLTEQGMAHAERLLGVDNLYDPTHMDTLHHIQQALKAHALFKKDVDYVVKDGQVIIVDEFTGRLMPGRRWSDGLHQAVEAKEGVRIESENQTLATITLQNYFRMYQKLAGMTGTAATEAEEFAKIYNLTPVIPTTGASPDEPPGVVYKTAAEVDAVTAEIRLPRQVQPCWSAGSIEIPSTLDLLKARIPHQGSTPYPGRGRDRVPAGRHGRDHRHNMAGRAPTSCSAATRTFRPGARPGRVSTRLAPRRRGSRRRRGAQGPSPSTTVVEARGLHIIGTELHDSRASTPAPRPLVLQGPVSSALPFVEDVCCASSLRPHPEDLDGRH